ncbi:unnamed protein product, partial [Prorocentrum cordatum]
LCLSCFSLPLAGKEHRGARGGLGGREGPALAGRGASGRRPPGPEVCKAYPERPPCLPEGPGKPRAAPAAEHAPRRIEVGERCVGNTVEPCASEVSTEAGDASNSPRMERIGCSPSSSAVGPK